MNEILELFKKNYEAFYIGDDEAGWLYFSKLIEKIQFHISDVNLDVNFKNTLMDFIGKFESITKMKQQKNYPLIADELFEIYNKLIVFKEFN